MKFKKRLPAAQFKDLDCDLSFNWERNIVQTIYDHATIIRKDLIIISIKNTKNISPFLLGELLFS